jgi:hypothetical protein
MERNLTPAAIDARIAEIGREHEQTRAPHLGALVRLYSRVLDDAAELRRLFEDARRTASEALERLDRGVFPTGLQSLAGLALDVEKTRERVEAVSRTIDLLEASEAKRR